MKSLLTIFLLILASQGFAAKKYVSDVLYLPVRTGPSDGHKIVGYLKSGTKVAILDSEEGYSQIKPSQDRLKEGWVKTRFLQDNPVAAMTLKGLQDDLTQVAAMKLELSQLKGLTQELEGQKKQLLHQLERIKKVSGSAIEIDKKNQELLENLTAMNQQLQDTQETNLILTQNQRNEGIKLGILALAIGVLLGFAVPYLKPRGRRKHASVRLR